MSLTFTRTSTGSHRADGETFSYVIDSAIPGTRPQSTKWRVRVFRQVVTEFKSDNTTLITLGDMVYVAFDERLRDVKAWAEGFETSKSGQYDYGRRAIDAANHVAKVEATR